MKKASQTILAATALSLLLTDSGDAALTMVADPVSSAASTAFSIDWLGTFLYDGAVTVADIGTTNNLGGQWAGQGLGPHYMVYNMGSSIELAGVFYAQRLGAIAAFDKVTQIDFWLQNSDPGTVTSDPAGAAAHTLAVTNTANANLTEYDFGGVVGSGQYVIMKMTGNDGNPGGSELVLGAVPEPGSVVLLGLAGFALALRRRG